MSNETEMEMEFDSSLSVELNRTRPLIRLLLGERRAHSRCRLYLNPFVGAF